MVIGDSNVVISSGSNLRVGYWEWCVLLYYLSSIFILFYFYWY
jgi:hypothetical protein